MDWKKYLGTNTRGNGDPVTALYLPQGHFIAGSFPLARRTLEWVARMTFGESAGRIIHEMNEENTTTIDGLRALSERFVQLETLRETAGLRYDPDAPKPLFAGLRVTMFDDALQLYVFRQAPFDSCVNVTIRPHLPSRDGTPQGPPLIGLEWETIGPGHDEALMLPETFGPSIRNNASAWPNTEKTNLTTVVFRIASHMPIVLPKRWSLLGFEWPANVGGIVCFGAHNEVGYLVTLPKEMAGLLIRRVGNGEMTIYGGEDHYVGDLTPHYRTQKF